MREYFSEYIRLTEVQTREQWTEAVFIFDTNVLLNLYRMSQETCAQIRAILGKLTGRLFLPHQVGVEFFRHREEEIAKQINAFDQARQALKKFPGDFKSSISRHSCIPIAGIVAALEKCAQDQIEAVNAAQQNNRINFLSHDDPILSELDELFIGHCETPYGAAEDAALNAKVEERVNANMPPCNVAVSNSGKIVTPTANNPHRGDGRVWFQIVKYAEASKKPIVFVTGDQKANWWRTAKLGGHDQAIGPHHYLIREIESASKMRFLMYTQEAFLSEASKYLGVSDQKQAIDEVRQIRESAAAAATDKLLEEPKDGGLDESGDEEKSDELEKVSFPENEPDSLDEPKDSHPENMQDLEKGGPEEGEV